MNGEIESPPNREKVRRTFLQLHKSRDQKRNIYDHKEYDDQSDQVRDNRFGDPLDRKSRDTGSNEQVDGQPAV